MVGVTIMAFLLASAVPSFSEWIRNASIRSEAESILNGLQHARMEAVRRNTAVRFQLTDTTDNNCALSASGTNWVVNMTSDATPASQCASTPSDQATPYILQVGPAASNSVAVTLTSSAAPTPPPVVTFNGFGQQTKATNPTTSTGVVNIDVMPSQGASTCLPPTGTGTSRCLRIQVMPAGLTRLCDPAASASSNSAAAACS